jgi:hypothetical protein
MKAERIFFTKYVIVRQSFSFLLFPNKSPLLIVAGKRSHITLLAQTRLLFQKFLGNGTDNEETSNYVCPTCPTYKKSNLTGNVFVLKESQRKLQLTAVYVQIVCIW